MRAKTRGLSDGKTSNGLSLYNIPNVADPKAVMINMPLYTLLPLTWISDFRLGKHS